MVVASAEFRETQVMHGRQGGKTAAVAEAVRVAVERGEHVHTASHKDGEQCHGGDPECPLPRAEVSR